MNLKISELMNSVDEKTKKMYIGEFAEYIAHNYIATNQIIYHPDNEIFEVFQSQGLFCLPKHFYAPIPSREDIGNYEPNDYSTEGIDWNENHQCEILKRCMAYEKELNEIPCTEKSALEYCWDNDSFSHTDAAFYYSLIRLLNPGKVVEIGAGNSTKIAIQALKSFGKDAPEKILEVVEPYPSHNLKEVVNNYNLKLVEAKLQDIPLTFFDSLNENDLLFYDGSHVVKYGADVNYFIFKVLPRLKAGVYVHIHDIFLPNDYPKNWIEKLNIFWNEQYLIHGFLMYNDSFQIEFSSSYMKKEYPELLNECFKAPLKYKGNGGGSLWIKKK